MVNLVLVKVRSFKLLIGLQQSPAKAIYFGNQDISDIPLSKLRNSIAYVPTQSYLLSTTIEDNIKFGKEFGYNIKLLGIAKETSQGLSLNVYPAFIPTTHPLASVRGSYNAIYVKGNGIDDVMLYGRGAGSLPTGSSVVSDIMEVAKNISYNETGRLKPFYYDQKDIYSPGKIQSSY